MHKIKINQTTLRNRIVISPMCQYSAIDGCPSNWHYKHLGKLILSGAGLLMMESTAINNEGKITHVGIIMENNHIIHASGRVRIDRIDQQGIFNKALGTHSHKLRLIKSIT